MKRLAVFAMILGAMTYSNVALAGSSDTTDVACGSSPAGWNAPNGALVLSRHSSGVIAPVINALGEYRTHSMLSHGSSYMTHSTMHSPGQNGWPTYCSRPLKGNELREGWPGISQVNMGAAYENQHGASYIRYMMPPSDTARAEAAVNAANWSWSISDYKWVSSHQNSSYGFWQVGIENSSGTWYDQPYVLYQYKDLQNRQIGWQWTPVYNGAVCSTAIAWLLKKGLNHYGTPESYTDGYVNSYTYDHTTIVNAGNALYNGVKDECDDGLGFWGGVGAAITCFENICDDAGRQVRNCMTNAGCCDTDSNSCGWDPVKNNANSTATSVSPDDLGGWSGHAASGSNIGPWAPYGTTAITWNNGGSTYGCWF